MRKIADNFCGYLKVGDDKYTYYISDNIVTLLPAQSDKTMFTLKDILVRKILMISFLKQEFAKFLAAMIITLRENVIM